MTPQYLKEVSLNRTKVLVEESGDVQEFAIRYFDYLYSLLKELDTDALTAFVEELEIARWQENTIFIVGNGGSAATASHMANDLSIGAKVNEDKPFRALALTDNIAVMTATANDFGYETLFVNQLKVFYRPGDRLIAISASGNSPNVVKAAEWVKDQGGTVMGLVGFDGGALKDICDIAIHVKTKKGEYGPVEDIHIILDHLIYTWFRQKTQKEKLNEIVGR